MRKYIFIILALSLFALVSASDVEISNQGIEKSRIINLEPIVQVIQSFLDLIDTPASYAGEGGSCVIVNPGETGLIFGNCSNVTGGGGGGDITAVNTDGPYLTGGAVTGDVDLLLDESFLNGTIDGRIALNPEGFINNTFNATYDAKADYEFGSNDFNGTGNFTTTGWFRGLFNWTTLTDWLSFDGATLIFNETKLNKSIQDLSLNETEANIIYLNLSGTNSNQNINLGNYNLTTPKVSLDELEFPNATWKMTPTNGLVNGTTYGFFMDGQTGVETPHLWIQPGGAGQASGIARSFIIVNELTDCMSNFNVTNPQCYADVGGYTWSIDFNTTTTGADVGIADDLEVQGDVFLRDTDGEKHFMTRELTITDQLLANTMSNLVEISISGNNLAINSSDGTTLTVRIGNNFTILDRSNDSVGLNTGTDLDPQFNYISYRGAANPILTADTSEPVGNKVHVVDLLVGASGSNVYGFVEKFSHDEDFVSGVYHRFFDMGTQYNSGLLPEVNTTAINITSGIFDIMIDEYATTLTRDSVSDGFYFVNSVGQFIQATDLSSITEYSDGTVIGNNKMVNVVWGVIPVNTTDVRIMAVIQDYPGAGKEYVNVDLAEVDRFGKTNIFPSDDFLRKIFVPVARTVFKSGPDNFQELTNGEFFLDLRGNTGGLGGSAPSPSITDHGDLDGLTDDDHTQYLLANGSRELTGNWSTGEFNISGVGGSTIYGANQTMFDALIANFSSWITNSALADFFTKAETTSMIDGNISEVRTDIVNNRTESESNLRADIDGNFSDLEERKINVSSEGDLNVNSSDYWDDMGTINATQMEDNGQILNIKESWLTTFVNAISTLTNYFTKTEVNSIVSGNVSDVRTDIENNFTELDNIKLDKTDERYNETQIILDNNLSWLSTFNVTYDSIVTNSSFNQSLTDGLYLPHTGNQSWNESYANTLYDILGTGNASWNESRGNSLYLPHTGNTSWNQSFADTLYIATESDPFWSSNLTNGFSAILKPLSDSVFDIGTNILRWANGYFDNVITTNLNTTNLNFTSSIQGGINSTWNGTCRIDTVISSGTQDIMC